MAAVEHTFHEGEKAVQARAAVPAGWTEMAAGFIRRAMPEQHRAFFEALPLMMAGVLDGDGRPWAVPLWGEPGFVRATGPRRLSIAATPALADDLGLQTGPGAKIGLLGIEFDTRRRNRVNGVVESHGDAMVVEVEQSFGNCPQYIQARRIDGPPPIAATTAAHRLDGLSREARELLARADTFFIASRSAGQGDDPREGLDVSHRGGRPGFIAVGADGSFSFPDFSGNRFFNTLGNIAADDRIGLFVPDFETGAGLYVTGRATIDWGSPRVGAFRGAERLIDVVPDAVWHAEGAAPAQTPLLSMSPSVDDTGVWAEAAALGRDGYRPFRVSRIVEESAEIASFHLEPADGGPIEPHVPGQHLPIRMNGPDGPLRRVYTISRAPNGRAYRISVKREAEGAASRLLHDGIAVGDGIEVGSPAGRFTLDDGDRSIVMVSAGVGITPMRAMLEGLAQRAAAGGPQPDVWFLHGARNGSTHAFRDEIADLARAYPRLRVHVAYSRPEAGDQVGATHDAEGRLTVAGLADIIPFGPHRFYLCGPEGFMRAFHADLRAAGIDRDHIRYEAFGSDAIEAERQREGASPTVGPESAPVRFETSGVERDWSPAAGSLLELAEAAGLRPPHNCRSGKCGACAARIVSGAVAYARPPEFIPAEDEALVCCAVPATEEGVVLAL